jgi:hypothetical protein
VMQHKTQRAVQFEIRQLPGTLCRHGSSLPG